MQVSRKTILNIEVMLVSPSNSTIPLYKDARCSSSGFLTGYVVEIKIRDANKLCCSYFKYFQIEQNKSTLSIENPNRQDTWALTFSF